MIIFSNNRGRVSRVVQTAFEETAAFSFPTFDYTTLYGIITGSSLPYAVSHQAMDTLGDNVLLSSFGESVQPMTYTGYIFNEICESSTSGSTGSERVLTWWRTENISNRQPPIEIVLGLSTVVRGYLHSLVLTNRNARDRITDFQMVLLKAPRRPEISDSRFAAAENEDLPSSDEGEPDLPRNFTQVPQQDALLRQVGSTTQLVNDRLSTIPTFNQYLSTATVPVVAGRRSINA